MISVLLALATFGSVLALGAGTAAAADSVGSKGCFTTSYATQCSVTVTNTDNCGLNPVDNFGFGDYNVPNACATSKTYWCNDSRWVSSCDVDYFANGSWRTK